MRRSFRRGMISAAGAACLLAPAGAHAAKGSGAGGEKHGGLTELLSPELRLLDAEEQALQEEHAGLPAIFPEQQTERIGYSGTPISRRRQRQGSQFIRFDLGAKQNIDRVVLVPADFAVDQEPGAGYGFPVRWRVEVADEASFEDAVVLADHTAEDFPNPGIWPVSVRAADVSGRYIRLTAVKLASRGGRSLLALGELMVLQGGRNLAASLPPEAIRVSDADEMPWSWSPRNLVDSQSVLGTPSGVIPSRTEGFQSHPESTPDAVKWVQVDLGSELPVEEVRLLPARAGGYPLRRGFGFPLRYRVEISADAAFTAPVVISSHMDEDFPNPRENPVVVRVPGTVARFVRVTASRLTERFDDYVLALAELQVISSGKNVALGATVTGKDARESGIWSTRFLTDGFTSQRDIAEWPDFLDRLDRRREVEARLAQIPLRRQEVTGNVLRRLTYWSAFIAGSLVLITLVALRRNQLSRRREMESLRQRIARDVHDEIGSGLGTIALLSQMAGAKKSHPMDARQDFSEIHTLSREITESLRDIVWLIRPETRTLGDLAQRLRETATSMLAAVPHEFEADPAVSRRELPLEFKRQVLLVFKEALHNLMRHAAATEAAVKVGGDAAKFTLELHDNGRGFDCTRPVSGAGMTGMRQRASTLGGLLVVETSLGNGTRLRLEVPWPKGRSTAQQPF
ncbi:MAG: discoidin domain-containing protein [Verrucomicrobiota bacterium]